jgi:hypothetical protein
MHGEATSGDRGGGVDLHCSERPTFENVVPHSSSGNALIMTARKRRKTVSLPMMMTDLIMASWETIARRTLLVAQNKCSPVEYQRMVREKAMAAATSGLRLISSGGRASMASVLGPWHSRAVANAKRLRKK